jgi:hypothetical protein
MNCLRRYSTAATRSDGGRLRQYASERFIRGVLGEGGDRKGSAIDAEVHVAILPIDPPLPG